MTKIRELNRVSTLSDDDRLPIYSAAYDGTRAIDASLIKGFTNSDAAFVAGAIVDDELIMTTNGGDDVSIGSFAGFSGISFYNSGGSLISNTITEIQLSNHVSSVTGDRISILPAIQAGEEGNSGFQTTSLQFSDDFDVSVPTAGTTVISKVETELSHPVGKFDTDFGIINSSDGSTININVSGSGSGTGEIIGADGRKYTLTADDTFTPSSLTADMNYWLHVFTNGTTFSYTLASGVGSDGAQTSGSLTYVGRLCPVQVDQNGDICPFNFKNKVYRAKNVYITGNPNPEGDPVSWISMGGVTDASIGSYELTMIGGDVLYGDVEITGNIRTFNTTTNGFSIARTSDQLDNISTNAINRISTHFGDVITSEFVQIMEDGKVDLIVTGSDTTYIAQAHIHSIRVL